MSSIRQFSANWSSVQDRILLRFNTPKNEEYRLWLTRLVVKSLFDQAFELIQKILSRKHDARVAALIQDFQRQKINNHMNAGQVFQEGGMRPLGDAAILVTHLNLLASDEMVTTLTLHLSTQQKIAVPLNFHALQSMVYLIEKLQIQAGWSLHLGEMRLFQSDEILHDDREPNNNNVH
jgi:hypothetical protein